MALDSILLSLHGASGLEVRRKKLLFGENKVLGSLFDRTTAKPLLSEHEERALEELYKHEKHKAKIRASTRPRSTGAASQRSFTPAAGGGKQQTGVNFEGGPRGRGRGTSHSGNLIRPAAMKGAAGAEPAKCGAQVTPPRNANEPGCAFAHRAFSDRCRLLLRT